MSEDSVKVVVLAEELGVSHKTIYNWIKAGRLEMVEQGFVSRQEAWAVYEHMREKRVEISYFLSAFGMSRDASGRFSNDKKGGEIADV